MELDDELSPRDELRDHDPRQVCLPGMSVLATPRPWVRDSARVDAIDWRQLELRLGGLARHRGRTWSDNDRATLRALRGQTWNAADLGQQRIAPPQWLRADVLVSPITGEVVDLGRNPRARAMLAIVWQAFESRTGGVMLTRVDWAAQLHCCPRSIYTYQRELEARGLVELHDTWLPTSTGRGSQRGPILMRVGPRLVELAGSTVCESQRSIAAVTGVDVGQAIALAVELRRRAGRRLYHASGAHYRRAAWTWGRASGVAGVPLPRGAEGRAAAIEAPSDLSGSAPTHPATFAGLPTPVGATTARPPTGAEPDRSEGASMAAARPSAPRGSGTPATPEARPHVQAARVRGSDERARPRNAADVPPSERWTWPFRPPD